MKNVEGFTIEMSDSIDYNEDDSYAQQVGYK